MCLLDDIRLFVRRKTGRSPDQEIITIKVEGVGVFTGGPKLTHVRTPDEATWCCYYDRPPFGEWKEHKDLRRNPLSIYTVEKKDYIVPDWISVLKT